MRIVHETRFPIFAMNSPFSRLSSNSGRHLPFPDGFRYAQVDRRVDDGGLASDLIKQPRFRPFAFVENLQAGRIDRTLRGALALSPWNLDRTLLASSNWIVRSPRLISARSHSDQFVTRYHWLSGTFPVPDFTFVATAPLILRPNPAEG
jgi:hypothetical protein